MAQLIWSVAVGLLVILVWDCGNCQATSLINTFDVNWNMVKEKEKSSRLSEFSPPKTAKSNFSWVASSFGPCFGCGSKSYRELKHDCVHKLPMQLTVGTFSRALMGVFRVPETECSKLPSISPVSAMSCGPPCSDLRLLRGDSTGCRCDHERKMAFDVPNLVCQNNRNRTASLSLCKFLYEHNPTEYQVVFCDYATVCSGRVAWIEGNWSQCSNDNSVLQIREVVCAVQTPKVYYRMHESMCSAVQNPPKVQFCARWAAEKIFKCTCATRMAYRRVVCIRDSPKAFGRRARSRVPEEECSWCAKPDSERPCDPTQLNACKKPTR